MHKTNDNIFFSRQLIAAFNSGNKAGAFFLQVDLMKKMLYNKGIKKERTTTMARRYRFLVGFYFDHTPVLATLMVTTSTKKSSGPGWLFSCSKTAKRCGRYVTYVLMQKHQSQFASDC